MYGTVATYPRNKAGQMSLERINRYLLRLSTNDYNSPYTDLLQRTSTLPIYQSVLHKRIRLAQQYSKGSRYLPPQTLQPYVHGRTTRRRVHGHAIVPSISTGLQFRDSALELLTQAWNRVPEGLVRDNASNIGRRLAEASYGDTIWSVFGDMAASVLVL